MAFASEELKLPYQLIEIGNGEKIEEKNLVEFRLVFSGELPSTGNKSRPSDVHEIRRTFHPQLRRLWGVEDNLQELAKRYLHEHDPRPFEQRVKPVTEGERYEYAIKAVGKNWSAIGFDWIPLVTEKMVLRCSLDVTLLRPEIEKGYVVHRGDLDGQVKTLVDALKKPIEAGQTGNASPQEGETPFFVLLEDDSLITDLRVTTDRLLLLPNEKTVKPGDCLAIIHVRLNHRSARTFDNYFG